MAPSAARRVGNGWQHHGSSGSPTGGVRHRGARPLLAPTSSSKKAWQKCPRHFVPGPDDQHGTVSAINRVGPASARFTGCPTWRARKIRCPAGGLLASSFMAIMVFPGVRTVVPRVEGDPQVSSWSRASRRPYQLDVVGRNGLSAEVRFCSNDERRGLAGPHRVVPGEGVYGRNSERHDNGGRWPRIRTCLLAASSIQGAHAAVTEGWHFR